MLSTLLSRDNPPTVADDPMVIETEHAWKEADAALQKVQRRYVSLKRLVTPPANQTLADLGATIDEQDAAIVQFPKVVQEYGGAKEQAARTRQAYDTAHAVAVAARLAWYEVQRDEQVAALVEVIATDVYDRVCALHDLVEAAAQEELRLTLPDCPPIPLRIGNAMQGGLETVIPQLRGFMKP